MGDQHGARIYHDPWQSLRRDIRRIAGLENYEIGWVKTGPKSRVGRFAMTDSAVPCEQCGRDERYFHCVGDHVSYPFGIKRDSLICHSCHIENRGENIGGRFNPREVFNDESC